MAALNFLNAQAAKVISFNYNPTVLQNGIQMVQTGEDYNILINVKNKTVKEIIGFDSKTGKRLVFNLYNFNSKESKANSNKNKSLGINQCVECPIEYCPCTNNGKPDLCLCPGNCKIVLCQPNKKQ